MLWIKTLHIFFVLGWFVGLFYLPRLYVNLAQETNPAVIERLLLMARKLFRFMTLIALPALGFGIWLWLGYGIGRQHGWLHAKVTIVLFLIAYHLVCGNLLNKFERGCNTHSHRWYRVFNEIPTLGLLGVLILVVFKPF